MPPFRHIPGQNARHPEDWFDDLKASVTPDTPPEALEMTAAWQAGLVYFEAGYFWECHEVLEAVWMQAPQGSAEREMTQALIQLANARLKLLMGRPNATRRLCDIVEAHLENCVPAESVLGLSVGVMRAWVGDTRSDIAL
ncbi:DUF309 domain-containing protein [Sulfitobacter sp. TSTF-M16]|uniref:DUF309 domain-containing protein n=1 Tax=Sulfitobacter aestuariivivens TaxID=2766981 RepID=A0A927D448_9RHOB|nr:DUF309 domain-containing protein [Sulfitobacter aestuariivivens]